MINLTPEEIHALQLTADGWPQPIAARIYGKSESTYRRALFSASKKLAARNLFHAVAIAATYGLITAWSPNDERYAATARNPRRMQRQPRPHHQSDTTWPSRRLQRVNGL